MVDWFLNEWAQFPMLEKITLGATGIFGLVFFSTASWASKTIEVLSIFRTKYLDFRNTKFNRFPCSGLDAVLKFLFSKRAYERVFSQVIGDFQLEYMELISQRREWKARWFVFCTYASVLLTVANYLCVRVVKQIKAIWTVI